jgi:hypothetical protein
MSELLAHIKAENAKKQAWIDEDPENRWAGMILEDVDYWADMGVRTVEQYEAYMMRATIWDLFKDVNGFRPRHMDLDSMSLEELNELYDSLLVELKEVNAREAARQAEAVAAFESKVDELMESGAKDRATAIRWLKDAEGDSYTWHDDDYFEYNNGLPYGYLKRAA